MFLSVQYGLLLGAGLAPLNTSYTCHPTCIPSTVTNNDLVFDGRLAFLNLDLVNAFVEPIAMRHEGREWISSVKCWIEALHNLGSPLIIFTRPYFSSAWQPELGPDSPFRGPAGKIGTAEDVKTMIYPSFHVKPAAGDVVLQKTGYSASTSNSLEQILHAQSIDAVVLSGVRTGGAVASTAYRLFDLGYKVYIIANNTIEIEDSGNDDNAALLSKALPKLPVGIITLKQALQGLKRGRTAGRLMDDFPST